MQPFHFYLLAGRKKALILAALDIALPLASREVSETVLMFACVHAWQAIEHMRIGFWGILKPYYWEFFRRTFQAEKEIGRGLALDHVSGAHQAA